MDLIIWPAPRADKINRILRDDWLTERARWRSCPFGTMRHVQQAIFPRKPYNKSLLTNLVRSRWLDIGLVLFCEVMDRDGVEVHKHAEKELAQYPTILTSHLVNEPYILYFFQTIKPTWKPCLHSLSQSKTEENRMCVY